jgi:hypothetical protein
MELAQDRILRRALVPAASNLRVLLPQYLLLLRSSNRTFPSVHRTSFVYNILDIIRGLFHLRAKSD